MTSSSDSVNAIVRPDSYLTLHYRIELASGPAAGSVFANTFDGRPGTLQMGSGQWAPGLEAALLNRAEGEHFTFEVAAADAYGERNPDLLQWVSRSMLDAGAGGETLEPGEIIEFTAPNGGRYSGVLKQYDDERALFDFNHPLAGIDLRVEVSLLGVL
ncbi:FKBP-type peptidyl-prolyl cis-trans isomerase [Yanghanlia caeni]|uniref:Peptidyl-prolyl cis-trans isomerase n=1 Tax=Yanghanlia caeni TaxID=3064283 RepID=A0ABU1D7L0_9BURK|nr:FKBP-type peptidyl-prolyl cis-trans isomerase [Alcaligenaceae bacterium LG-2]HZH57809.1 FKBP-type peptidyl-prolyl cis-trans isomerase [Burkholderiaceae bacterium]